MLTPPSQTFVTSAFGQSGGQLCLLPKDDTPPKLLTLRGSHANNAPLPPPGLLGAWIDDG
jgi:hypothetical protein